MHETGELLWMSERDGWCHIWLYDAPEGRMKNQVTCGEWLVREVLHVDPENRELWFMASGLDPSEDPYHLHLCRIRFDGSGFVQLTESDGNHRVEFSPNREYLIASWSRVDHPPVHELRRSCDGRLVCALEQADAEQLLAAGWTMPERFVAMGRDGETDIHGILIKPSHFDPAKRYPVIEEIYAGPHSAHVPKRFDRLLRQHTIAELGFIVVQIDGMGTNHRGKAFHDVCWKNPARKHVCWSGPSLPPSGGYACKFCRGRSARIRHTLWSSDCGRGRQDDGPHGRERDRWQNACTLHESAPGRRLSGSSGRVRGFQKSTGKGVATYWIFKPLEGSLWIDLPWGGFPVLRTPGFDPCGDRWERPQSSANP